MDPTSLLRQLYPDGITDIILGYLDEPTSGLTQGFSLDSKRFVTAFIKDYKTYSDFLLKMQINVTMDVLTRLQSDMDLALYLCDLSTKTQQISPARIMKYRINARMREIRTLLQAAHVRISPNQLYLDIGSNDGRLTQGISRGLSLRETNTYGVDVATWGGASNSSVLRNMKYFRNEHDYHLDYISLIFGVISALQTLHHTLHAEELLDEMERVLQYSGVFILREHDFDGTQSTHDIIDFEHFVHLVLQHRCRNINTLEKYLREYYAYYRSSEIWTEMLRRRNFKLLGSTPVTGLTRTYVALYQKMK